MWPSRTAHYDVPFGQPGDYSFRRKIPNIKAERGHPLVKQVRHHESQWCR